MSSDSVTSQDVIGETAASGTVVGGTVVGGTVVGGTGAGEAGVGEIRADASATRGIMADAGATPEDDAVVRGAAGMPEPPTSRPGEPALEDLEEAMRDVVDPELGINVVDLGLVYGIQAADGVATIDMTLTSAACPLTDVIEDQTRAALTGSGTGGSGLVDDIKINWVWLPPWGPEKITEDGREQLRALGFRV